MSQKLYSKFEVLRPGPGENIDGILPDADAVVGIAMKVSAVDADTQEKTFALATGAVGAAGLLSRPCRSTVGLTDTEQLFGFPSSDSGTYDKDDTGGIPETPFTHGGMGSLMPLPDEMVVEGADYLDCKTGATGRILSSVAMDSALAFGASGKLRLAQTGDYVQYRVRKSLTVTDDTVAADEQVRLQVYRVHGYLSA